MPFLSSHLDFLDFLTVIKYGCYNNPIATHKTWVNQGRPRQGNVLFEKQKAKANYKKRSISSDPTLKASFQIL